MKFEIIKEGLGNSMVEAEKMQIIQQLHTRLTSINCILIEMSQSASVEIVSNLYFILKFYFVSCLRRFVVVLYAYFKSKSNF